MQTLSEIAVGIARELEYLHRGCYTMILHFDMKPQNTLLYKDFCPKFADFGLAKLCKPKEGIVSMLGASGTAGYTSDQNYLVGTLEECLTRVQLRNAGS